MFVLCLDSSGQLPSIRIKNIDKVVHFCFHFGFVWLWYFYINCHYKNKNIIKSMSIAVLLSVVYGVFIEFLQQQFTTTRKADILDVLANFVGAVAGVLVAKQFQKQHNTSLLLK